MATHITVVPASTKAGRETIRALLTGPKNVHIRAIYRSPSSAPAEFVRNVNFEAVQGDVSTGAGLDFSGSSAVFYIPPPSYDGTDLGDFATVAANNINRALLETQSVKKLLLLSSMGSQYSHDIGILKINHISDTILKDSVSQVLIAKPGYFQENWMHGFQTAQGSPPVFYSPVTPIDHQIPMVSITDVGDICATVLLAKIEKESPHYFNVFGPRHYSSLDVKQAIEELTGKEVDLIPIQKEDLAEFFAQDVPQACVKDIVEMTTAALPGGIMSGDFAYDENTLKGKITLVEALRKEYSA